MWKFLLKGWDVPLSDICAHLWPKIEIDLGVLGHTLFLLTSPFPALFFVFCFVNWVLLLGDRHLWEFLTTVITKRWSSLGSQAEEAGPVCLSPAHSFFGPSVGNPVMPALLLERRDRRDVRASSSCNWDLFKAFSYFHFLKIIRV